jgi:2-polyprenyl-3-methyl-5-hydroxy-6-metoxy-1,4-benzoquinol methylase
VTLMSNVVHQSYWDDGYSRMRTAYRPERVEMKDLFDRYLPTGGTCFEVGCYPGDYLIYLGRQFGYTVNGIDLAPGLDQLPTHIRAQGVEVGTFHREDFLTFAPEKKYDVVYSLGFVEHFTNFEEVIEKHVSLLNHGGTLVLACPNFRGLQYVLHRVFDAENLRRHCLKAMNLRRWRRIFVRHHLTILYHGYYGTAGFWTETTREGVLGQRGASHVARVLRSIDRRIHWPNSLLSPYMASVVRKEH